MILIIYSALPSCSVQAVVCMPQQLFVLYLLQLHMFFCLYSHNQAYLLCKCPDALSTFLQEPPAAAVEGLSNLPSTPLSEACRFRRYLVVSDTLICYYYLLLLLLLLLFLLHFTVILVTKVLELIWSVPTLY